MYNRAIDRVKTVTIAIPSLHRPDLTERCIEFVQRQTLPRDEWEIVVIENAATPDNILPDPLPCNTTRLELPQNEGTTGSINRALSSTDSRYVLLLNNDVELDLDYLERLVRALDADPELGFVTGKLLRATLRTYLDGAGDAMLMAGAGYRLGHRDLDRGQYDQPMTILAGCGAAVLYRRDIFQRSGCLDTDFFAYLDDLDLGLRTQLLSHRGLYLPEAVAFHIGSATFGERLHPLVIEYLTRNQIFLLAKDYPRAAFFRLLPRIVVYQILWFLFAARNRRLMPYLRGLSTAIRKLPAMRTKHLELMAKLRITNEEFLARLRDSERQIYDWHHSQDPADRSSLLKFYFRVFGRP